MSARRPRRHAAASTCVAPQEAEIEARHAPGGGRGGGSGSGDGTGAGWAAAWWAANLGALPSELGPGLGLGRGLLAACPLSRRIRRTIVITIT